MRILVVTPYLPWPLNSGGNAAQFATLKCLMHDHEFVVVALLHSVKQQADLEHLRKALPKVRFVGVEGWEENTGRFAKNPALLAARKIYREAREVLLQPDPEAVLPHYPFHPLPANLIQTLNQELEKGVDVFQAEFAEMMSLGAWLPRTVPRLFIHHQIHFVYAQRFIQAMSDGDRYARFLESSIRTQEIAFLKCFNTVVTFSHDDQEILRPLLPGVEVASSPFPLPADVETATETPAQFNGTFCYMASEAHLPNRDALAWLLEKIWPKISASLPSAKLKIIGDWSAKTKKALSGPTVHFTGFVRQLSSVMSGGILLVPLRVGSGIRVKILAAMALGTPVVTTRIGGEGLAAADGREMLVRDTTDDFATAAIELARQPALWQRLSVAGRESVFKNYSPESVRERRNQIYNRLVPGLPSMAGKASKIAELRSSL